MKVDAMRKAMAFVCLMDERLTYVFENRFARNGHQRGTEIGVHFVAPISVPLVGTLPYFWSMF